MFGRIIFIVLFFIISSLQCFSQTDIVFGNAKTYSGDTLKMFVIDDYISNNESLIATSVVDSDGNFKFNVKVKNAMLAYIDLTVFKAMIFLQPNSKQEILLPEKQQITLQDALNPYFRKAQFYVKVVNDNVDDLNNIIPEFDKLFNQAMNKVYMSKKGLSKSVTDSIENKIKSKFNSDNSFFQEYISYRFALLDYTAYHKSKDIIVNQYFTNHDILLSNPAYSELFDELFSNIFTSGKTSAINVKDLYLGLYDNSYYTIKQNLSSNHHVGNERFADYLILKGLKDSYYSDSFPKEHIVAVTDSFSSSSKNKDFRKIANNLYQNFTTLLCGYQPPEINLSTFDNKIYNLQQSSGKFVYLNFFNPNSYTAISDLELIKQIRKDFPPEILDIVTIFVSSDKNDMSKFLTSNSDISWKVLWYNFDTELLKKYNVKAFPMYYLVNPNGILVMNPAPSPQENFSPKFNSMYRNWKNEQYRQQYNGNQGIK